MTKRELDKLTPEQKRIKIAIACGWTWEVPYNARKQQNRLVGPNGSCVVWKGWSLGGRLLPDYLNDLNAMHEAEKALPPHLWGDYTMNLRAIIQRECNTEAHYLPGCERACLIADLWFYHATAAQRADAFLLTVG